MKRERKHPGAIIAAALVCAIAGTDAQSGPQRRAGTRWEKGALILVLIDAHGAPAAAEALVERAMTTWTEAAEGHFTLRKTTASDGANVRVHFVSGNAIYGEARPRVGPTGDIIAADVRINGDVSGDAIDRRIILYLTALHELGHAIGLPHTDEFSDIMYSFRRPDDGARYFGAYRRRLRTSEDIGSARATGLSAGDLAALRTLYHP
jgi:hypothetical protein